MVCINVELAGFDLIPEGCRHADRTWDASISRHIAKDPRDGHDQRLRTLATEEAREHAWILLRLCRRANTFLQRFVLRVRHNPHPWRPGCRIGRIEKIGRFV